MRKNLIPKLENAKIYTHRKFVKNSTTTDARISDSCNQRSSVKNNKTKFLRMQDESIVRH